MSSLPPPFSYRAGRTEPRPGRPLRCAWVTLVMLGDAYVPGALALGGSLRFLRSAHPAVCMVTADVTPAARAQLALVFDAVVEVDYLRRCARPPASAKQAEMYGCWSESSFTKWRCLGLLEYDRVMFVDADMLFVVNPDELFALRPPAGCFSLPWAWPTKAVGGVENHYVGRGSKEDLAHQSPVPAARVLAALHGRGFVVGGFLVLLEPSAARLADLLALLDARPVYAAEYTSTSSADELAISELYAAAGVDWTHISPRYAAIPGKADWVDRDVRAFHFFGRGKPWHMAPDEYPDLVIWWRVADRLSAKHPSLRAAFHPPAGGASGLDADAAQLRLTNDLRGLLLAAAKAHPDRRTRDARRARREADSLLERWLMALVNEPPPPGPAHWARVYRLTEAGDPPNAKLALELVAAGFVRDAAAAAELVGAILGRVAGRLASPPPAAGAAARCGDGRLAYGGHFAVDESPRLAALVAAGGCEAAVAVALRYAVVVSAGQQWGLPQAHVDFLYDEFGVRNEAFASPLNSRLFGKPGAAFCSAFPDTDAPFGSLGSFFEADLGRGGGWVINPPFVEALMARAARRAISALSAAPLTVFMVVPAWLDSEAYLALRDCPHSVAELRLTRGEYFYEDPSGARVNTQADSVYFALSSEGDPVRGRLAAALHHFPSLYGSPA